MCTFVVFFFQAEDGIRDLYVTGVQTCALPISPLETVRHVSCQEKEKDSGKKLRETGEAKVQRAPGDFVDLPANRDRLHLGRSDDAEAGQLKMNKAGIAESNSRNRSGAFGTGHRQLLCHKNNTRTRRRTKIGRTFVIGPKRVS